MKLIKIKILNQKYVKIIQSKYPKITSGRKNYNKQYDRVLKNILLTKKYKMQLNNKLIDIFKKSKFKKDKNYLKIFL